jgi:hypothetical protein
MVGQARQITEPPRDLRALKALVGFMGVLIVLGTALVIGVIIHRIYASAPAPSITGNAPAAMTPAVLPAGAHIAGIAAAGDDVAIWTTGAAGDRLLLLNPRTGQLSLALRGAAVPPPGP